MQLPTSSFHCYIPPLVFIILAFTLHVFAAPKPDVIFEGTLTLDYVDMPKTSVAVAVATPTAKPVDVGIGLAMLKCLIGKKGKPPFCNEGRGD
ncbi:Laccase-1 [Venturia inaequalis]|nr:hypothetical protein EG327_001863 [Venturia inaequalis]RDI85887.1 Laccase-1 [Venturia inaequalis]